MDLAKTYTRVNFNSTTNSRTLAAAVAGQTARLHSLHVVSTGDKIRVTTTGTTLVEMGSAIDWEFVPQLEGIHLAGTAAKALVVSTTAGNISGYAIVSSS